MFSKASLFTLALVFLLACTSIMAQTPGNESSLDEQENQQKAAELKKEVERKTFALLDEVIGGAQTLKLPENRALLLSAAADLLWLKDEKRARALFKDALNNLTTNAIRLDEKMSDEQRRTYWTFAQLRKEILQVAARHDADLALELLHSSRPAPPAGGQQAQASNSNAEEQQLEQSLALQVAENDPRRALQMAESHLADGYSYELIKLLNRLNDKDPELAARFADDLISRLHSANLADNQEAAYLAMMLIRLGSVTSEGGAYLAMGSDERRTRFYRPNERQTHELLDMATSASLNRPPGNQPDQLFLMLLNSLTEVARQFPERAAALRQRLAESTRVLNPQMKAFFENQELFQTGTVERLLEAAATATEETRDSFYEQAAWKALNKGENERARQIAGNVKDSNRRNQILESFESFTLWDSIKKGNYNEARARIARMKSRDERAALLTQLAYAAATRKDQKLALDLMSDAMPLLNLKPRNDTQLNLLLQAVRVYAMIEPGRAFELIELLAGQANDLLAAASTLSGFLMPAGMFRKGEMVLPPGYSNATQRFRSLGKQLGALALLDFDRTKAAAEKFQRSEVRLMARLFIIQAVLTEQLGTGPPTYGEFVTMGNVTMGK